MRKLWDPPTLVDSDATRAERDRVIADLQEHPDSTVDEIAERLRLGNDDVYEHLTHGGLNGQRVRMLGGKFRLF